MIEAPDFLPLGSVVSLEGNPKKLTIIGRALLVEQEGEREYYDYGLCLYPEGMMGDGLIYSNHENINAIHFKGFEDAENDGMVSGIRAILADLDIPKARPQAACVW